MVERALPGGEHADAILRHWLEAVPHDRLAHLVKDATRAFVRALQVRLAEHGVSFGHWTFLRILWERDGLTQKQLSDEAGVIDELYAAVVEDKPPLHDGAWGLATVEACLAILRSAREAKEIPLAAPTA
jgi:predicted dehydrogenase